MITSMMRGTMGLLFAASVPTSPDPGQWAQWGLAGLVISYVMWRDWQRERRMSEDLQKHQTWVRDTLLDALERNTAALERMAAGVPRKVEGI